MNVLCLAVARAMPGGLLLAGLPDVPDGNSGSGSAGRASAVAASSSACGLPEVHFEIAVIVPEVLNTQGRVGQHNYSTNLVWSSNVDVLRKGGPWGATHLPQPRAFHHTPL